MIDRDQCKGCWRDRICLIQKKSFFTLLDICPCSTCLVKGVCKKTCGQRYNFLLYKPNKYREKHMVCQI
jgi:hypothetical protein